VKRTRIATDDAPRVTQKSHQWTKLTVVDQRGRISTRGSYCIGKIALTWAIVYDATQTKRLPNPAAKFAEAIRRPTLGAPASAWTQYDVPVKPRALQKTGHFRLIT
jgi:hypothetical protein